MTQPLLRTVKQLPGVTTPYHFGFNAKTISKPLTSIVKWLYGPSELRVILVGEGATGKTTFVCQLLLGPKALSIYTVPTMGYYLTPFNYKRHTIMFWDTVSKSTIPC